jgi:two-component system chemotaxis sensor kinase CheA
MHLVRNACDHGIEFPHERSAAGKIPKGEITVQAQLKHGIIEISIEDNGKGLAREKILQKAIEKGMITPATVSTLTEKQIFDFIFQAGFSTAKKVSDVSGRGVGMDVVRSEIAACAGKVTITSKEGQGTRFLLSIPETRSVLVEKLAIFSLGTVKIALPVAAVSTIFRFDKKSLVSHPTRSEVEFQNQLQPLMKASDLFRSFLKEERDEKPNALHMGVLLIHENRRMAIEVNDIDEQIDAVVRPLDETTKNIPACKGIALLADDNLAYVLSPEKLVERAFSGPALP